MQTSRVIILLACTLVGCAKMTPAQVALNKVNSGVIDKSSRPACEIQTAEYALDAKLVSFEVTNSAGVNAGFDLLSGFMKLLSIDFKASSGSMTTAMSLYEPINPQYQLVNQLGSGTFYSFGADVDVGFSNIGAGFSVNHQTPMSTLVQKSLNDTLDGLTQKMDALQSGWHTDVMALATSTEVVIHAGSFAGLKVGDRFAIWNVVHQWSGTPCASEHLIAAKTTKDPLAYAEVTQLANNAAVLTLVCSAETPCPAMSEGGEKIAVGATVEIDKLTDADRTLSRLLEIRNVTGATIQYEDSKSVDVSSYLKNQIGAIAADYGFLIYVP